MAKAYRLTPKRKQSILKAAKISAARRHAKGKKVGYVQKVLAKGIKKVGDKSTLGVAGYVVALKELNRRG